MEKVTKKMMKIPKTIEGLRDALLDEINSIRTGGGNLQQARAVSQLAAQAIDTIRVQIQYGRLINEARKQGPIRIGSEVKNGST